MRKIYFPKVIQFILVYLQILKPKRFYIFSWFKWKTFVLESCMKEFLSFKYFLCLEF